MPRGVKKGLDTKKFDRCVTKVKRKSGKKSIRTQSVTQACQAKRGAEENRYNLNICSYLKNINSIFFSNLHII